MNNKILENENESALQTVASEHSVCHSSLMITFIYIKTFSYVEFFLYQFSLLLLQNAEAVASR